jgi:PKD repeat protein
MEQGSRRGPRPHRMKLRAPGRRSLGQSLVEFVLILPILLLMLLVTVDFGRLFMSYVTLNNVTRVAANFGSVNPGAFTGTPSLGTYNATVAHETPGLNCALQADGGGHNPPVPTYPSGTALGATSVANMTCNFVLITPFMSTFFGGPLPISASAEFPVRTGAIANIGGGTTLPAPGAPVADFTFVGVTGGTVNGAGGVDGTVPVTVNVTNNSSLEQTWEWNWGDGSDLEYTPLPAAHTFASAGTFTVTLTVSNTAGTASRSRTVTVTTPVASAPAVAGFYGTPVAGAPQASGGGSAGTPIRIIRNGSVDFHNTSTDANTYSWDFGDGTAANTQTNPRHTFAALGIYDVTLSVTDPTGASPYPRTAYITVGCLAPNFAQTSTAAANATWVASGFTGKLEFQPVGANGGSNKSSIPPSPARTIVQQVGVVGGELYAPTQKNNQPWVCGDDVVVKY